MIMPPGSPACRVRVRPWLRRSFLVLDELAGPFHRAEQRLASEKARRRFVWVCCYFDFLRLPRPFASLHGHELVAAFTRLGGFAAIDLKPAGRSRALCPRF